VTHLARGHGLDVLALVVPDVEEDVVQVVAPGRARHARACLRCLELVEQVQIACAGLCVCVCV
jgi:hypothetical protein